MKASFKIKWVQFVLKRLFPFRPTWINKILKSLSLKQLVIIEYELEARWLGIVRELLSVKGDKKEQKLSVIFDSGTSRSLINSELANELSTPRNLLIQIEVTVADGHKVHCKYYCNLIIEIENKGIVIQPLLVDDFASSPYIWSLGHGSLYDKTRRGQKKT